MILFAMLQQIPAQPGYEFPLWEVLGVLGMAATVLLILIRYGLRKPPDLATVDDVAKKEAQFEQWMVHMEAKLDELKANVVAWEKESRETCATARDLTALGSKVDQVEKFYLTVNDNSIRAIQRSARALREVKSVQGDIYDLKQSIKDLVSRVEPIPERLGRIDENLKILARQGNGQGRHP